MTAANMSHKSQNMPNALMSHIILKISLSMQQEIRPKLNTTDRGVLYKPHSRYLIYR